MTFFEENEIFKKKSQFFGNFGFQGRGRSGSDIKVRFRGGGEGFIIDTRSTPKLPGRNEQSFCIFHFM